MKRINFKALWQLIRAVMFRDFLWKLLSVLCAFVLWSYVVSTDTRNTLPRYVTIPSADITLSGTKALSDNNLALLTNLSDVLSEVSVRVDVTRANYSRVTARSVKLELDLSKIRQKGTQVIEFSATSAYGRAVEFVPPSITVEVEALDSRYIPVEVQPDNVEPGYQCNVRSTNPSSVVVSGPSSIVKQVKRAVVVFDATGCTEPIGRTEDYFLVDANGNEILIPQLAKSSSSVIVNVDIYPEKTLPVDLSQATKGTLPEGYELAGVSIDPGQITVSGKQESLNEMDMLYINPLDISGHTATFREVAQVKVPYKDLKLGFTDVSVEISIVEKKTAVMFMNVPVAIKGKNSALDYSMKTNYIDVTVTGPYHTVKALKKSDLIAVIDLTDYQPGSYEVQVLVTVYDQPDLQFEVEPRLIQVTIS